ncbi:hypothetical protein FF1_013350 [Malus domestica]
MAANTFINKLIEECSKCQNIIDRNKIKTIQFEDEPNVSHQTISPLFKDNVPEAIVQMLKEHCLKPLFQGYDWMKWESARPQGVWLSTTTAWVALVTLMEPSFSDEWKALDIFEAIKISTIEMNLDRELMMVVLSY